MSSFSAVVRGDVKAVADTIYNGFMGSGVSCELTGSSDRTWGEVRVITLVFEKYMARVGNRASLTVTLSGAGGGVAVDAVGSGAGNGAFLSFSWGAEDDLVMTVQDSLRRAGYIT